MTDPLRFPIGTFSHSGPVTDADRAAWISDLDALPAQMHAALDGLTDAQLDTPYRPGGWTLRQVAHHVPDSHLNAYTRFKLALTEDTPTIRPYAEAEWARLPDVDATSIGTSLALLSALHARWTTLLRALPPEAWARTFLHPESGRTRLDLALGSYAWHGRHHLAHITTTAERHGWT